MNPDPDKPQRGVRIAILGDLHYEKEEESVFTQAKEQILGFEPDALVCLGDIGGYSYCGSQKSFEDGRRYLSGFGKPFYAVMGNHDMEGKEFATDKESVSAWCKVFGYTSPYYAVDLGHSILFILSSSVWRDNKGSCHEIHIDDEQAEWFENEVKTHKETPIFVFSHAPILGSGIRVLQNLHLKIPNAYLNHSDRPERFIRIVKENPQIKLWFSAHNHLGQYYSDSIGRAGGCTFVHTGVIAKISRDGFFHSRYLEFGERGFALYTLDHGLNQCLIDVFQEYDSGEWERYTELKEDAESRFFPPPEFPENGQSLRLGKSVFCVHKDMLVEYDAELKAPLGIVEKKLNGRKAAIRKGTLILVGEDGTECPVDPRSNGRYYKIYYPNPNAASAAKK